ncbi:hypothetical protein [Paracoccus alkanivorans]|uniref:Uncharacterized protein n=1 Tax=Paracoccus alkanivorans TaxID=2116655 RepID=A0A3M0MQP4_9RHOB|nr:hypothetical protein [Paracoccus alkanivorans]RMC33627.1 hypothetical protein C9E81_15030 [Paracoccus alkanivorans]
MCGLILPTKMHRPQLKKADDMESTGLEYEPDRPWINAAIRTVDDRELYRTFHLMPGQDTEWIEANRAMIEIAIQATIGSDDLRGVLIADKWVDAIEAAR